MAPEDPNFSCFFGPAKKTREFMKFEYPPTFFHDFDPPRALILGFILETLFFECFFIVNFKSRSSKIDFFSFF